MEDWYNIYLKQIDKNGGIFEYMKLKISQKKKLLNILKANSGKGKFIEAGCGTGIICSQLASENYNVTGIDIDTNILSLAANLENVYFGKNRVKYVKKSIFELDYKPNTFDVCYSVGVLEHFTDDEIVQSLSKQINIANKTILVIPTKWFNDSEALHGDDRFLEISYWRNLIDKSGGKVIREYSYPFRSKNIGILTHLKRIFRPKAYRVFLIEKKQDISN